MAARIAYTIGIFVLGFYALVFVGFQLRELVSLFEGMSLQLPLATRLLIMLGKNVFIFLPVGALVVVVPTLLGWLRSGARWLAGAQFCLFLLVGTIVMGALLPMLLLVANLQ